MTNTIAVTESRTNSEARGVLQFTASIYGVHGFAVFATEAERDAALAAFPKSYGAKSGTVTGGFGEDEERYTRPLIRFRVSLDADGVNGGYNETGVARLRKLVAKSPMPMEYYVERGANALPADEFLQLAGL